MPCFYFNGIGSIIKAFKIACLSYNPNDIIFEGKSYTRKQLLEYRRSAGLGDLAGIGDNSRRLMFGNCV